MTTAAPPKPRTTSAVTAYAERVIAGDIVAGRWVRLACERHLRDLDRDDLRFDDATAKRAINFFGRLNHSKGEWGGDRIILEPWEAFIVGSLFGWQLPSGLRRFRESITMPCVAQPPGITMFSASL